MIKLDFQVNKHYLTYILLNKSEDFFDLPLKQKVKVFKQNIWEKHKNNPLYYFIHLASYKHVKWAIENIYLDNDLQFSRTQITKLSKDIQKIFQSIFRSQEFKIILKETTQYKNSVKRQWDHNQNFVLNYLEEMLGQKLPNLSLPVYIIHPKLKEGRINSKKSIIWGHSEDWPNYSTVYLAHELLHILFNYYKIPQNKISHAIIELISDNELRIKLNKKGGYFKEEKEHIGHSYLRKNEKIILPYWLKYLKKKQKNIYSLYKTLEKNSEIEK
ncbi:MAG: hypothetical protein PHO28_03150 [Candidatus Pacebacteria bacterium]|nr:hypothetical protein [Candidatus Paceibacterota bacterium]